VCVCVCVCAQVLVLPNVWPPIIRPILSMSYWLKSLWESKETLNPCRQCDMQKSHLQTPHPARTDGQIWGLLNTHTHTQFVLYVISVAYKSINQLWHIMSVALIFVYGYSVCNTHTHTQTAQFFMIQRSSTSVA